MKEGKLVIFSAPSGAGKTTIVKKLMKLGLPLKFSISACTRSPRPGELNGIDYHFLTVEAFHSKAADDEFVEWEEVYENQFYGTLNTELTRIWNENFHVVFDIDVMGGVNLKKKFGDQALSVFIQPPSIEELENRLRNRDSDDEQSIRRRIRKAQYEMTFADQFDKIILNQNLEEAVMIAKDEIEKFLKS